MNGNDNETNNCRILRFTIDTYIYQYVIQNNQRLGQPSLFFRRLNHHPKKWKTCQIKVTSDNETFFFKLTKFPTMHNHNSDLYTTVFKMRFIYVGTLNIIGSRGLKPTSASVTVDTSYDMEGAPRALCDNKSLEEDTKCQQHKGSSTSTRHGCQGNKYWLAEWERYTLMINANE